jgi:hypothetical protein
LANETLAKQNLIAGQNLISASPDARIARMAGDFHTTMS